MGKKLSKFKEIFDKLNEQLKLDPDSVQLDWDYFEEVFNQSTNVKHVIIGESPYPEDASGIPFIKSWKLKDSVGKAGDKALKQLGISCLLTCNTLSTLDFALKTLLKKEGIVFLNASYYHKNRGDHIAIDKIKESSELNTAVLQKLLSSDSIKFTTIGTLAHKIFCQIYTQLALQTYRAGYHSASSKSGQKIVLSQ